MKVRGRSRIDARSAAVSSTQPAAVSHDRSGCWLRKKGSERVRRVRLLDLDEPAVPLHPEVVELLEPTDPQGPQEQLAGSGGVPARVSSWPTSTSRRENCAVDRRQVGDQQGDEPEADGGGGEGEDRLRQVLGEGEPEGEQRRPAPGEGLPREVAPSAQNIGVKASTIAAIHTAGSTIRDTGA